MLRIVVLAIMLNFVYATSEAQHREANAKDTRTIFNEQARQSDSLCNVLHDLGSFEGHFRSFFMNTVNQKELPDYYALGLGGGLAYYSPIIKNFQLGLSGFIIYNINSSHLGSRNGYSNRYELALFDVTNPDNHEDLDRLENLYLRYYFNHQNKSFVQVGKFHISTPLINLQDSRMRPNLQEGLWMELNDSHKLKAKAGWLWRTSPRSTIHWSGIGESVGIYNPGKAVNGQPANYPGNIKSNFILIGNIEWDPHENFTYQSWNYFVDNLFNVSLQKLELRKKVTRGTFMLGAQYIWQTSMSDKTTPIADQYISPDEQSHVISSRIAFAYPNNSREWSFNYTRITAHGRFLFPREWGAETFYTYNNRERNEGAGDVQAVMLEHIRYLDKDQYLSVRGLAGIYLMPDVNNARLNKYTMPSYYHLNIQGRYKFKGFLHGLQTQILYIYKGNLDKNLPEEQEYFHNKVDMHHVSLVMDYYF